MDGYCFTDTTGHLSHLVAKVFYDLSSFVPGPHFLQGLDKRTNGGRFDLLVLLDDREKDLGTGGVVCEVLFNRLPSINNNRRVYSISDTIKILSVEVADREIVSNSVPNPHSCKGLNPLGDFPIFG